ncbi:MAG: hypothetical protein JW857_01640, partial [Bacteroidales bacterium]|nr:hypothetical protein [Bacteroidales bacterium]
EQVLSVSRNGNNAFFPKFESYEKRIEIKDLFQDINFTGGILIEGSHLSGFGDEQAPASIQIYKQDTLFIKLRSTNFSISPDHIRSDYASVSIRYKNDSIYHSGLHMNFSKANKLLSLSRDDFGLTANPFYDTYHQINIYVEAVYWKLGEEKMSFDMAMGRTKSPAQFESVHYFSKNRFNRLQGIDNENPLVKLKRYANDSYSTIIYFDEYAKYLKMPKAQVKLLLLKLAHEGFLLYDAAHERAKLGDKIDFYLDADAGNIDSDVIRFESRPNRNESNASLAINNFDLQINGIDQIILSDSQNLIIEPTNRQIILKKNKDFSFDGKVTAGRLSFASKQSNFSYNEFKINMPAIDSLWFWVQGPALPDGRSERKWVQTAIRNLNGELLIDHPDNKSGLANRKEYPIFNSKRDAYVYYNKKHILGGVYRKEQFYFHVNPFTFSSLNTFNTDDISFSGYLASGSIFPDIAQALTVQEDYSLGFTDTLPEEGLMAYGNKGRFFQEISLSNKGLRGKGRLSFINSVTQADDFIFFPDSTQVIAQLFKLTPALLPNEFPEITGTKTKQIWYPNKETMQIISTDSSFKIYNNESRMNGELSLSPTKLTGKGDIKIKTAVLSANLFTFKNKTIQAPKATFSAIGNILKNYSALTDYEQRTITFTSNDGTSKVDFPDNLYMCYMDQATWYMDKDITDYASSLSKDQDSLNNLSLRQLADTEYKGSNFISLHPNQDSVSFYSTRATFNSRDKIIEAKGVHYLKIADAVIFPENNRVTILKQAEMIPLENSKIIANAVTKYHEINNASVKILGRRSYIGSGDYVYIDKNFVRHPIHFEEIKVDSAYQTIAQSEIFADDFFTLSPEFYFRGYAKLKASRKLLEFDGGFKNANACLKDQSWIKFKSVIDPENLRIPVDIQPIVPDISRQQKYAGFYYSDTKKEIYPAFFSNKTEYYDPDLLRAHGFIMYDENSKEFRISSLEKLNQAILPDDYLSLNTTDCSTFGEGEIKLNLNFQELKMKNFGTIAIANSPAHLRIGSAIDFHFSNEALKRMADQFLSTNGNAVDNNSNYYSKMIAGFLGIDETEQFMSQLIMGNLRRIPGQLQHTIMLNDLKLKWNSRIEAYISQGDIGIETIGKYHIHALVKGKVEIKKSRIGNELTMYFENNNHWYFFKYANHVMQVLSSDEVFNDIIQSDVESKGEKNRLKKDRKTGKQSPYRYILSKPYVKDDFLKQLNTN